MLQFETIEAWTKLSNAMIYLVKKWRLAIIILASSIGPIILATGVVWYLKRRFAGFLHLPSFFYRNRTSKLMCKI